ncbi:ABC transporter ATP-binding protein [Synechococcus sp. RSCCF101]|uniref:ABC transporter ATP-binding protein n=1 Tax=Synechococcus sp. RSCCF101 TaxID=2511069 RepID=UPI00177EDBFD|nr:ABC transporter ATP-binding protein [Synechococcus sp. RSCCF101]
MSFESETTPPDAVAVEALSKGYRIYNHPRDRLLQGLLPGGRRRYREFWALRNVQFRLGRGRTLGVVGRNGSGKSTLLQLICGTLTPSAGTVHTSGRIGALLELGSGFDPDFTGLENIFINGTLLGMSRQEIEARLEAIIAFADIGDFIHQPVKTYSSGMAVRLAFSVQANTDPEVLVVDEALAVGDELFQRKCYARLEQLKASGTSILLVTHSCPQIVNHCDLALLLHRGRQRLLGDPKEVTDIYQRLSGSPDDVWDRELPPHDTTAVGTPAGAGTAAGNPEDDAGSLDSRRPAASGIEGLVSRSRVEYPSRGARIEALEVRDAAGNPCDSLPFGMPFRVWIRYSIDKPLREPRFACRLTDTGGIRLTGQIWSEAAAADETGSSRDFAALVRQGSGTGWLEFRFTGALQPGFYFLSASIWEGPRRTGDYVHRITDALAMRVQLNDGVKTSFGLCDLTQSPPEEDVWECLPTMRNRHQADPEPSLSGPGGLAQAVTGWLDG